MFFDYNKYEVYNIVRGSLPFLAEREFDMFKIGDKVVCPMHGAGVIEKIEDREILGETKSYYILEIPYGHMQVMIPVDKCEDAGLRPIISNSEMNKVIEVLKQKSTPMDENWNRRLRDNNEKLKSGDPKQVAEVIRNLVRVEREKKLSSGEKKLLNTARQILSSEMVLVTGITETQADATIDAAI